MKNIKTNDYILETKKLYHKIILKHQYTNITFWRVLLVSGNEMANSIAKALAKADAKKTEPEQLILPFTDLFRKCKTTSHLDNHNTTKYYEKPKLF